MASAFDMQQSGSRHSASYLGRFALAILLALLGTSCGETYRPIAQPIPGTSPTPAPEGHIFAVSANGLLSGNPSLNSGSVARIDVSGDSVLRLTSAGVAPVHAALTPDGSRFYVANSGEDTVSVSFPSTNLPPTTIDLVQLCDSNGCPPAMPVFVHSTENLRMYVADEGNGTISAIDIASNAVARTFAVSPAFAGQPLPLPDRNSRPVALAELPNGTKIYSVNSGAGSVSSINTLDGSIAREICVAPGQSPPCPSSPAPTWAVASNDNRHVYVLDDSGSISVIDTLTDAVVFHLSGAVAPGSIPNQLLYDANLSRVYVTDANALLPAVALFDVSGTAGNPSGTLVAHVPARATIVAAAGSACTSNPIPSSIAVIGDGSRGYVASYQTGNNQICTQADVIDTGTGRVAKTIPLSQAPDNPVQTNCDKARFRVFATTSLGGVNSLFKVYVSQCDAGSVAVIDTFSVGNGATPHPADWLEAWVPSAVSAFPPSQITITSAAQTAGSSSTVATTTFSYTISGGAAVQAGMTVNVTGMSNGGNNGVFVVTGANASNPAALTFTVNNPSGVTASSQSGNGSVLPAQNPVFLVAGP